MRFHLARSFGIALCVMCAAGFVSTADAAVISYIVTLNGPSESPPNLSPGIGTAQVDVDAAAHTLRIQVSFSGLVATTTASHIHAATSAAGSGTAGVAVTSPSIPTFPLGVTSGSCDVTLDMTLASSYSATYMASNGGTPASAEAALHTAIAAGKAYLNIHTGAYPGGEIRGFLVPGGTTATDLSTWGRVKALYR